MAQEHVFVNLITQSADWYCRETVEGMAASLIGGRLNGCEKTIVQNYLYNGLIILRDTNNYVEKIIKQIEAHPEQMANNHSPKRLISKLRTFKTLARDIDERVFLMTLASRWFEEYARRNFTQMPRSDIAEHRAVCKGAQ